MVQSDVHIVHIIHLYVSCIIPLYTHIANDISAIVDFRFANAEIRRSKRCTNYLLIEHIGACRRTLSSVAL